MIGPLSSQLNAIKWGEFKLGDLFEKLDLKFKKKIFNKQKDISKVQTSEFDLPLVNAKNGDNGIMYYGRSSDFDIVNDGAVSTANVYPQPLKTGVLYNAYLIKPKFTPTRETLLFFTPCIYKAIKLKFSYENKASWNKVKNELISLPLKPTAKTQTLEDIDFDFMEKFIAELEQCRLAELEQCRLAELEQCRLAELEAYLKATGLENTTLSSDEENALNVFNNSGNTPCGLTWQSFRLGDLFEIRPTKAYNLTNHHLFDSNAKNPVVTNSSLNNGISGYSSLEPTEKGNQITYSDTTTSEGIFYQKRPFIGYSHVQGLYPLKYHEFWNEKTLLYIVVAFKKVACGRFDYGNKFNRKIASEMSILLPTNPHGGIDFNFMRTLINALMKQTIQGVAQYCDAKIQATKEAISQETPVQKDSLF